MTFHCPLCEQEIETESVVQDGQHVVCPYCQQKFTYFANAVGSRPQPPLIIASGEDFESYLCSIINELANAHCEQTKASGDQGVDLIVSIKDGKTIAIQCKLYSTPVGNDAVQQVIAGRIFYKCDMAAVVTNNTYTQSAIELASASGVALLHYSQLKEYVANCGAGTLTSVDLFRDSYKEFALAHPNYAEEVSFLLKYYLAERWSVPVNEMVSDMTSVLRSLEFEGRRMMLETYKMLKLLLHDVCVGVSVGMESGVFGRTIKRIHEAYKASNVEANYVTLDADGKSGLENMVSLVCALRQNDYLASSNKNNRGLKDQLFKDELPDILSKVIERGPIEYDREELVEAELGFTNKIAIEDMERQIAIMFGTTFKNLAKYFNRG